MEQFDADRGLIVVKGRNGLGNRLLTLEYACRMAVSWGRKVHVDWRDDVYKLDQGLFSQFIEFHDVVAVKRFDWGDYENPYPKDRRIFEFAEIQGLVKSAPFLVNLPRELAIWRRLHTWSARYVYRKNPLKYLLNGEHVRGKLKGHDLVVFICEIPFREPEMFRHIKLNVDEMNRLVSELGLKKSADVAVHIRNTDKKSIRIDNLLMSLKSQGKGNRQLLHLATDSESVYESLVKELQDYYDIQSLPIKRGNTALHLQNDESSEANLSFVYALLDIYLLSMSKVFYYQVNSSFSRVALAFANTDQVSINWMRK